MRKLISLLCSLLVFTSILCGCSSAEKSTTIADDTFLSESVSAIPENSFSFADSEFGDIEFESYKHEHGTSSVNSSILIYRYDDTLIFAVSYFMGPDGAMETFVLNQEQGDAFLAMVENYKKAKKETDNSHIVGGYYSEYVLNNGSKEITIEPLPLSDLGLSLKDEDELVFVDSYLYEIPSGEGNDAFPSAITVGHFYPPIYSCIGEQAYHLFGSEIISVEEVKAGPIDGFLRVTLEDGSSHRLLVTNAGFIVRYV